MNDDPKSLRTKETDIASLRSMAGWPALHPSMRATCKAAVAEIELLRAVAASARELVQNGWRGPLNRYTECMDKEKLTALESALAAAGYDMTDEEFEERARDEPPEDGECFRGGEAASYLAEQQDATRRLK